MDTGSTKSLFVLLSVIVFGIFLSLSYWFFAGDYDLILQDIFKNTGEKVGQITMGPDPGVPTNNNIFEYKNDEDTSPNDTYYGIPTITAYNFKYDEFDTNIIVDYSKSYRFPLRTEVFISDYIYDPSDTEFNNPIPVIEKNHITAIADYNYIDPSSPFYDSIHAQLLDTLVIK